MFDIEARVLIGWYSLASQSERLPTRCFYVKVAYLSYGECSREYRCYPIPRKYQFALHVLKFIEKLWQITYSRLLGGRKRKSSETVKGACSFCSTRYNIFALFNKYTESFGEKSYTSEIIALVLIIPV